MHPSASSQDTIVAPATAPGEAGLSVLRISGSAALQVASKVFRPASRQSNPLSRVASHTVHYGHILDGARRVDEVLVTVMRAPRTYTREDVVEVSCHGGPYVTRRVLDLLLAAGARMAQPGEFARRAFLNGRLDLAQAEAVADLIHARTELALTSAQEQLEGHLSRAVDGVRDELMHILAHVEAHIDFPEEDIRPDSREELVRGLERVLSLLSHLLATAREGQVLRRGVRAAIVGRPNAGKSSLLNRLLGHDRAIVSPVAGTTRDTIEETAAIRGIPVVFIDTAGLRPAADPLEEEGIRRTRAAVDRAEIILHLLDRSVPWETTDEPGIAATAGRPRLLVLNKSDLPVRLRSEDLPAGSPVPILVSCATGEGLEALRDAIARLVLDGAAGRSEPGMVINARHEDALRRAKGALESAREGLARDIPLELAAADLRAGVHAVGEVVGRTSTEDLLDSIFSQFCLGK